MENQEILNQNTPGPVIASQPQSISPKTYSIFTRILIPYRYLNLWEKLFLIINILALSFIFVYLIKQAIPVIKGESFKFGMVDWILIFANMQSIPALRYKGLTRIPAEELDDKLQNQLVQSDKFKAIYSIKFAIFLWFIYVGLTVFSVHLFSSF